MEFPDCAFVPAPGLHDPHLQTVFAAVLRPRARLPLRHEAWPTADGDVLDLEVLPERAGAPGLLLLHGLEGSSRARYVRGLLAGAMARGWNGAALNFRSCGPTPHRHPRTYHSGFTDDLEHVAPRLRERWGRLGVVGFSLGGNVVSKWLGERGASASADAAVAVSVPFDLAASAAAIDGPGLWGLVYRERFLRTLRRKARSVARTHSGLLDEAVIRGIRTFAEYDDRVTARLNGFRDAMDYWAKSSSGPYLASIRVPTLLVSSQDDPIAPIAGLPRDVARNSSLAVTVTSRGGHVGFVGGTIRRPRYIAEEWALEFLGTRLGG